MKKHKVSVIVPIYNVEPYLRRCLDSLINQSLREIEIICVNDCSPDNSLAMVKEYAEKDERIKIIDFEKNQGVSMARNAGMKVAKGEYIGLVDPDDYVDLDYYEKLYLKAKEKNLDMVYANQKRNAAGGIKEYVRIVSRIGKLCLPPAHWSAIYKADFLRLHSLKYPDGIKLSQDLAFLVQAQFFATEVEFVQDVYYHYITRYNSARFNIENAYKSNGMWQVFDFINEKYIDEEYRLFFGYFYTFYFNVMLTDRFTKANSKDRQKLTEILVGMYKKRKYEVVYKNIPKFIQESDLENPDALCERISNYVDSFQSNSYEDLCTKIESLQNRKLYVWGTGLDGLAILDQCEKYEWKIDAFLDSYSYKTLTEFNGHKILNPQDVLVNKEKDFFIIISPRVYASDIAKICEQAGLKECLDFWRPR